MQLSDKKKEQFIEICKLAEKALDATSELSSERYGMTLANAWEDALKGIIRLKMRLRGKEYNY